MLGDEVELINTDVDILFVFTGKMGSIDSIYNPAVFVEINEKAFLNVLKHCAEQKLRAKIIFPSTRLLYDNNVLANELDVAQNFKTIYAVNKYACEQYLKIFTRIFELNYCIVRISIPYGTLISRASSYGTMEMMLEDATEKKVITIYGDGSVRRTVTYIEDLCRALMLVAQSDECINDTYNIGGETKSLLEIAEGIAKAIGQTVRKPALI